MHVIYANEIQVTHNGECFLLALGFIAPDGKTIRWYIALTPSGACILHDFLEKALVEYTEKYGPIKVEKWQLENNNKPSGNKFSV